MTSTRTDWWVVYSPNESAIGDGAGYWSDMFGWIHFDQATRYPPEATEDMQLPLSVGGDARLVPWREAQNHYG